VSDTTNTPVRLVAPKEGLQDIFIRGDDDREVYFRDGETATKHLVRPGACGLCDSQVQEQCGAPSQVYEGEINGLPTGEDFVCTMATEGGPVHDLESGLAIVGGKTNPPTPSPTTTLTTTTTVTSATGDTTTLLLALASGGGSSMPWWPFLFGLLILACCAAFLVFAYLSVQKSKAAEKQTRAAKIKSDMLDEEGGHSSEESTDEERRTSFRSDASEPLMGKGGPTATSAPTSTAAPGAPLAGVPPNYPREPTWGSPADARAAGHVLPPVCETVTAASRMPAGTPSSPKLAGAGANLPDMDLVIVTPQGLAVTPLNGTPPPAGVPMLQGLQKQPVATGRGGSPQAQEMDLVTVTPQGLAVTALNGRPPPAGVPYLSMA
jgi:hypothetical protein